MKSGTTIVLLVAAMAAVAFMAPSFAIAETTALCTVDENPCKEANQVTEVSFTAHNNISILSPLEGKYSYGCDASLSATASKLGETQTLKALSLVFSSCGQGCTRTTETLGTFTVSKAGTEAAEITANGFTMKVSYSGFSNCVYSFEGQTGTLKGALLAENGHITYFEAPLKLVSGLLCPKEALFDALFEAANPIYVSS